MHFENLSAAARGSGLGDALAVRHGAAHPDIANNPNRIVATKSGDFSLVAITGFAGPP
jgi:hypothetical protein